MVRLFEGLLPWVARDKAGQGRSGAYIFGVVSNRGSCTPKTVAFYFGI